MDRFSKFPSAKITSSASSKTVIDFLTDYIHLQIQFASITLRVLSAQVLNLLNFINIIFCFVSDHRSNGLVEKFVHTVKSNYKQCHGNDQNLHLRTQDSRSIGTYGAQNNRKPIALHLKNISTEHRTLYGKPLNSSSFLDDVIL